MNKVVVHVPHASTRIPDEVWPEYLVSKDKVLREAEVSADLNTDRLALASWPQAAHVIAGVSRIVVDVERYADDSQEEMSKVGRGMFYTADHAGKPLRLYPDCESASELKSRYYDRHWDTLRDLAEGAIVIDLHTYPQHAWPVELNPLSERPEIDIGFTTGLTPENWVTDLTQHFESCHYSVGHNTPYPQIGMDNHHALVA